MKKILLILVALLATTTVWAADFVCDVVLVGGSKLITHNLTTNLVADGWTLIDFDLNAGAGGDYIYLLYRTESNDIYDYSGYVNDFYISTSSSSTTPDEIQHNGRTYQLVTVMGDSQFLNSKGDLNCNAEGAYIHLYYTSDNEKDYCSTALNSITIDETSSGAVGENGGTTPCDLNKGCGPGSKYIYMHTTSAEKGWTMTANASGTQCTITGYAGNKSNKTCMLLPITIDGARVMNCADGVFNEFTSLDTLFVFDAGYLEQMPKMQGCSTFKQVNNLFDDCYYYDHLASSIKRIPDYAFVGTAIKQLHTNAVTQIGAHAFDGCNLSWITVDAPNVTIGDYAFANLSSDQCIIYSAGDLDAWNPKTYMYSYRTLVSSNNNLWYCGWCGGNNTSNDHLYWTLKDNHLKINCATDIWNNYPEKQVITSHNWYSNIIQTPINKLTMEHVDTIGQWVFNNYDNLKLVDIKSGARYIDVYAFYGCDSLQLVYLPSSVKQIAYHAFESCNLLTDIYFDGNQQQWDNVTKLSHWKPDATKEHWHCTVTFNANGHGTTPAAQNIQWSNQDKATEPTPPTANGYNFQGWYTEAACTTPWDFNNIVPGDMTLYAKWEKIADIPGDVDGDGSVTAADVTILYNFMLNNDASAIVNGDQDGDGHITAGDITFIYNILLGNKK